MVSRRAAAFGHGLHTGAPATVAIERAPGPVRLRAGGAEAAMADLTVADTARATTVEGREGRPRLRTVEHLLAAFAGLGVYEGVCVEVEGPELPLLGGGALEYCDLVRAVGAPCGRPRCRVARSAVFRVGESRYEMEPGNGVVVEVQVELGDTRLAERAQWRGDSADFVARIAPARTFARMVDVGELMAAGLARHVDPRAVVLLTPGGPISAGREVDPDEPARHKLLDLVGDAYLFGGPPVGVLRAFRPGHAANTRALSQALADGALVVA